MEPDNTGEDLTIGTVPIIEVFHGQKGFIRTAAMVDKFDQLKQDVSRAPTSPGVYLFKNAQDRIIYVGKAKNLKKRLQSYFSKSDQSLKTLMMMKKITGFETIITHNAKEALILESNLIKTYRPKYNVILKDDKRYPSLRLDIEHPYPALSVIRKPKRDGAIYFGPYTSSRFMHQTLKFINKTFKLRKCSKQKFRLRSRPCLNYQIGQCLAPCFFKVDKNVYDEMVKEVILFLKGNTSHLIKKIKNDMVRAASVQDFETAAELRDRMRALEKTLEKQVSVTTDYKDRDVVAVRISGDTSVISLLKVRSGYLIGTSHFDFQTPLAKDTEPIGAFLMQYYENADTIPKEILVSCLPDDHDHIQERLSDLKGKKVRIAQPKRGEKYQLIKMAMENAQHQLKQIEASRQQSRILLSKLQKRLGMTTFPSRIECFDNSNLQGTNPVSGMVVFIDGKPEPSMYRKYLIQNSQTPDDYGYMDEALRRRFHPEKSSDPLPDLLILDGGKGQLNVALAILEELDLYHRFQVISIAKKNELRGDTDDKIYIEGRMNPISFEKDGDVLLFLKRIRDEAHRFAITFHRKQRQRATMESVLDTIPGIGKKRKQALITHFGDIKAIAQATVDDIRQISGFSRQLAERIHQTIGSVS